MKKPAIVNACILCTALLFPAITLKSAESSTDQETIIVPTVAVLPFEVRTRDGKQAGEGKSVSELISIALLENSEVELVERAELDKAMDELQLSVSGLTDKNSQNQLGKITGAKILVTGSIFRSGEKNYLVAKVIGTETSRVVGCSVSSSSDAMEMTEELSEKISAVIEKSASKLLHPKITSPSVREQLAEVKGNNRKVYVHVPENISVAVPDPAAETELKALLLDCGFEIVNEREEADFAVIGEAIAEAAGSYRQFASATARVELSIYAKGKKLLAAGALKETVAGTSYVIAAKDAITQATLGLAVELFPTLKE